MNAGSVMGGYYEMVGTLKPYHMLNNLFGLIAPKDNGDGKTWMSLLASKQGVRACDYISCSRQRVTWVVLVFLNVCKN